MTKARRYRRIKLAIRSPKPNALTWPPGVPIRRRASPEPQQSGELLDACGNFHPVVAVATPRKTKDDRLVTTAPVVEDDCGIRSQPEVANDQGKLRVDLVQGPVLIPECSTARDLLSQGPERRGAQVQRVLPRSKVLNLVGSGQWVEMLGGCRLGSWPYARLDKPDEPSGNDQIVRHGVKYDAAEMPERGRRGRSNARFYRSAHVPEPAGYVPAPSILSR